MIRSVISAPMRSCPLKRMRPVSSTVAVGGFADVVKQNAEDERDRNFFRQQLQHHSRMLKDVAFRMKLLAVARNLSSPRVPAELRASVRSHRANPSRAPDCGERKMRTSSSRIRSALISLIVRRALPQRFPGCRFDLETEHGGETNRAQHAQPIFRETLRRIADRPNQFRFEIGAAADKIDDFILLRIEKHSVDGEIAPLRVFFGEEK